LIKWDAGEQSERQYSPKEYRSQLQISSICTEDFFHNLDHDVSIVQEPLAIDCDERLGDGRVIDQVAVARANSWEQSLIALNIATTGKEV
jgi:hypothetical protein